MRSTEIYGVKTEMQGSLMAVMAYYDEFGTDFHQDYWKHMEAGYAPVAYLLHAAWAMAYSLAKSEGRGFPHFDEWASGMDGFDLKPAADGSGWVGDVLGAIKAEMFRDEAPERPAEG